MFHCAAILFPGRASGMKRVQGLMAKLGGLFAEAVELRLETAGLVTGKFYGATITSAFQPIVCATSGRVIAQEALARSYSGDGEGLSPWRLFSGFAEEEQLVRLDRLCRAVHTLNYLLFPQPAPPNKLFLNVHERLLHAVADGHGAFFREVLARVEMPTSAIAIDIPKLPPPDFDLLARVAQNYRQAGFRVALNSGSVAEARRIVRTIRPDFVRFDAHTLKGDELDAEFGAWTAGGTQVIASRIGSEREYALARSVGAPLLQGFFLARPGPARAIDGLEQTQDLGTLPAFHTRGGRFLAEPARHPALTACSSKQRSG
jgi:EAL domain-containing protein (putative c-di-GMP-specific phosphodiesterase class I)